MVRGRRVRRSARIRDGAGAPSPPTAGVLWVLAAGVLGCGVGPIGGGSGSLCNTRAPIRICTDRAAYRPGDRIPFTVFNRGSVTVFEDLCAGQVVGRRKETDPWSVASGASRRCDPDLTPEQRAGMRRPLDPGAMVADTFQVTTFAFQGMWRLELWFLDADGQPISSEPFTSIIFDIFPSADR
ncbi:MAG: hypothetical protein ACE5HQ_04445 [Gemmatimonadota bacterium]